MNRVYGAGFTVIEVMLFLAVSGALAIGILATAQISINEQRYHDTITGVQSKLQSQYNQAVHVVNFREDGEGPCGATDRGASNCIVLGRLVQINGTEIVSSPVVAEPQNEGTVVNGIPVEVEDDEPTNDPANTEAYFMLYDLHLAAESLERYEVPWQSRISNINSGRELRMLVVRSPQTGLIYTYSADVSAASTNYNALITSANRAERQLCIPRNGWGNSNNLGVFIRANANSASSIELATDTGDDVCA